jgi:uncharacterized protein (TIGR00730 family)
MTARESLSPFPHNNQNNPHTTPNNNPINYSAGSSEQPEESEQPENIALPEENIEETMFSLYNAINSLNRIKPRRFSRYRVTIFGSARMQPSSPIYQGVQYLAGELTKWGCDIVTGGGPGLMEAANQGNYMADPENKTRSIGIRVNLSYEQHVNPFVEDVYFHHTFFSRLHHFVLISDAFVVVPGGIGTLLEAVTIWQLLQVGQISDRPLIMVGEMWEDLVKWTDLHMVNGETPLINPADLKIPECVDNFDQAIAILKESHHNWLKSQDS